MEYNAVGETPTNDTASGKDTKAVTNDSPSRKRRKVERTNEDKTTSVNCSPTTNSDLPVKAPNTDADSVQKSPGETESKEQESGKDKLNFSVSRIAQRLASHGDKGVQPGAPVYLAAVLEHMTAEVLQSATAEAKSESEKRIYPQHIQAAVRKDEELRELFSKTGKVAAAAASRE